MLKRTGGRLRLGIDAMANRSALHEDDRMMAVLARDGGRQARDELRLRLTDDLLETLGGQMVTFIHDEMAVFCQPIAHDALAHQALDDRHVERAGRLFSPAADATDRLGRQPEKRRQSLAPIAPAIAGDARAPAY